MLSIVKHKSYRTYYYLGGLSLLVFRRQPAKLVWAVMPGAYQGSQIARQDAARIMWGIRKDVRKHHKEREAAVFNCT